MKVSIQKFTYIIPLIIILLSFSVAQAEQPQYSYGYCSTNYGESTDLKYVVSSVFKIRKDVYVYHISVENSFRSYIDAEFGTLSDSPNCSIRYDSYQEAADKRNDEISNLRSHYGWPVHIIRWAYFGD